MKLAPDLRIEDLDPLHWRRILELGRLGYDPEDHPERNLLVYTENGLIRKAIDSGAGAVSFEDIDLRNLEATRMRYGVKRVTVVSDADIDRMRAVQGRLLPFDDFLSQALTLVFGISRESRGILTHPPKKNAMLPPVWLAKWIAGRLVPPDAASALFIIDGERLWTALISHRSGDSIDLMTGFRYLEERGFDPAEHTPAALHEALEKAFDQQVGSCLVIPKGIIEQMNRGEVGRRGFWRLLAEREIYWNPCPVPRWLRW
jgi:hypothetical protein